MGKVKIVFQIYLLQLQKFSMGPYVPCFYMHVVWEPTSCIVFLQKCQGGSKSNIPWAVLAQKNRPGNSRTRDRLEKKGLAKTWANT